MARPKAKGRPEGRPFRCGAERSGASRASVAELPFQVKVGSDRSEARVARYEAHAGTRMGRRVSIDVARRRAFKNGDLKEMDTTIQAIKIYLNAHKNLYRCGDCLARELSIDRPEIDAAFAELERGDQHVFVEGGRECGLCNETKNCLIMR